MAEEKQLKKRFSVQNTNNSLKIRDVMSPVFLSESETWRRINIVCMCVRSRWNKKHCIEWDAERNVHLFSFS